jgi:hypothetical protein
MFIVQENRALPGVAFLRLLGQPTDDEVRVYIAAENARLERERHVRLVLVLELKEVWTSIQRRMMRDFELENMKKAPQPALGMVMVVPNSLIRGAFTAYYWLAPPSYPTKMVATALDGYDWIVERLEAVGLPKPTREKYAEAAQGHWTAAQAVPGRGMVPLTSAELAGKLSA